MSKFRTIKSLLYMISEKLMRLIFGLFVSGVIARYLGSSGFGELNYYLALLSVLIVICNLGINKIITREIGRAESKEEKEQVVLSGLFIKLSSVILVSLLSFLLCFIVLNVNLKFEGFVFLSLLFLTFDVFDYYEQGKFGFKLISVIRLSSFIFVSIARLFLVYFKCDFLYFIILVSLEYFILALLFYVYIVRRDNIKLSISAKLMSKCKKIVSESWPEAISGIIGILFIKVDQFFLKLYYGDSVLGIYTASSRLNEAWYLLPVAIISVIFPRLVELKKEGNRYHIFIQVTMDVVTILSVFYVIFMMIFSEYIVDAVYGDEYKLSSHILVIHSVSSIFMCMGLVSGAYLTIEEKLKFNLYRQLLGLLVVVLFNYIFVPRFGVMAAAYSLLIGMFFSYYLFDLFHSSLRWMFLSKTKSLLLPITLYRVAKFVRKGN